MSIICFCGEAHADLLRNTWLLGRNSREITVLTVLDELLETLRNSICELVLLHLARPDVPELVRRVTTARPDVPVILLTPGSEELWQKFLRNDSPPEAGNWGDPAEAEHEDTGPRGTEPIHHLDLRRALAYMEDNIFDPSLSLDMVAAQVPVSRFHFSRVFKKHMGISFRDYVIRMRMEAAKEMLAARKSVTEVCFAVGYNDLTNFGRIFRKVTGRTPSMYRTLASANRAPRGKSSAAAVGE